MKNEIILFENQEVKVEVIVKRETVRIKQKQLSILFDDSIKAIDRHINMVPQEEVDVSIVAKFATVQIGE